MTIIKSSNDNIFGGFTEKEWSSEDKYVADQNAFVFSLINKEQNPFKVMCSDDGQDAICCASFYGPTFGSSSDIKTLSDSKNYQKGFSDLGDSYKHPDYKYGTEKAQSILGGSLLFQIIEIEVFCKEK